jgi:hypothetical protein
LSVAAVLFTALAGARAPATAAGIFESGAELAAQNRIDELLFAQWKKSGIAPANLCSDSVFVRRVYLDAIGTLPTADEASGFLADTTADKRRKLIDELLEREEFADYRAMKWADLLRVKAEFPINLWPNAAQTYYRWIRDSFRENKPYDVFVRELLISSGSNFRVPPVNFYRAMPSKEPEALVRAVALTLMGERSDKWSKERLDGMMAFFSYVGFKPTKEWKEEIVFFDLARAMEQLRGDVPQGVFPDGTRARLSPDRDPRRVFADWLIRPDNSRFTRNIVNRIWYWLLGRGVVHEPDDFRPDNPPSHPELLSFLEKELVAAQFDLKHIYRLILSSTTYQLASVSGAGDAAAADQFACYRIRRLEAEVLVDALCQITGTTEKYSSQIPEPFTFVPESQRSIALADGSITSPFLDMFGRPSRDTGLGSERDNKPTPEQRLHILNSSHVQRKLRDGPKIKEVIYSNRRQDQIVRELYLMILSRFPTDSELKIVAEYSRSDAVEGREGLEDLAWALVNSAEFLHRH